MNKEAFVYRWRELSTNKWYVGYHKGTVDDGYTCSSEIVKPLIETDPSNWERKVLRFGSKEEMIKLERRILKSLNARTNTNSYNRSNGGHGGGKLKGSLSRDHELSGKELKKLTADEIADLLVKLRSENQLRKLFKLHKWIMAKVF